MGRIEDLKARQVELDLEKARIQEEIAQARRAELRAAREAEAAGVKALADRLYQEIVAQFGMPRSVGDAVWALAWEHGHSSGFSDVENYYGDFAELALKVWNAAGK